MSFVFHRNPRQHLPVAISGDGPYLIDAQGKRYLDGSFGAVVLSLGHSDREVIEAGKEQLQQLLFAHTPFFANEPMEAPAEDLVQHAPEGIARWIRCSPSVISFRIFRSVGAHGRHPVATRQRHKVNNALIKNSNLFHRPFLPAAALFLSRRIVPRGTTFFSRAVRIQRAGELRLISMGGIAH